MALASVIVEANEEIEIVTDPVETARLAGLRYVTDAEPGIRRKPAGKHFTYTAPDGQKIRDEQHLKRIKSLAIPPAWTDVWISPRGNGHLQATGRDARGRKQYRYHPQWRKVRDETKYYRMLLFGQALPRIRARVNQDLALPGMPREKILATIVRLLEETLIRVGNEEYVRANDSYGLTTLHNEHVDINGSNLEFHFRGKRGVEHQVGVRDPRVARIIKRLQDLPGHHLFEYVDDCGDIVPVGSHDVNEYLREMTGEDFTAKDFRTWGGTLEAARALEAEPEFERQSDAKHNVVQAVERAAKRLGNTPAICRKSYVHPDVIDAYMDHRTLANYRDGPPAERVPGLDADENALMSLMKDQLLGQAP